MLSLALTGHVIAADKGTVLQNIPLNDINDKPTSLKAYSGKIILLVNVASKCGYTPQYSGLEKLYRKYKDQGLVVIGVPSNDFGEQEPGTADEIKAFCSSRYNVTFPLMAKIHVTGEEKHPLYSELTGPKSAFPGEVKWNFQKFIIGRDGVLLGRFDSKVTPDSPEFIQAIQTALARS
jgi:glutathione peroxidase